MALAGFDQHLAGARIGTLAMRFQARDLQRCEAWEIPVRAVFQEDRWPSGSPALVTPAVGNRQVMGIRAPGNHPNSIAS